MPPRRAPRVNRNNGGDNPNIAEIIAQQLQAVIPQIVTQVTTMLITRMDVPVSVCRMSGNGGNNNGCTYKGFLACGPRDFDGKGGAIALTRWIEKMESVMDISNCADNQKVKYAANSLINKALTWWNTQIQARGRDNAVGMKWEDFKSLLVEEFYPSNEMEKLESELWNHSMVGANHVAYTDRMIQTTQTITIQSAILKAKALTDEAVRCGTLPKPGEKRKDDAEDCRAVARRVTPINAKRVGNNQRACYECGNPDHFHDTCPRLNRAPSQVGNRLTIEGNQNQNNGNQARGRAFNVNANDALQDPNVVT
ncbi:reverse transcriptase domain-containing protein, partial [Tanacetum coccineum]